MKSCVSIVGLALLASSVSVSAQTCESVYAASVRDVDMETRSLFESNNIFNEHCEVNGALKSSSTSVDLTIPVKALKIGFSGSRDEAKQTMQDFCKVHAQRYQRAESFYKVSSVVVADALKSYNQCKAIEVNKVNVYHAATDSRSVIVAVNFNPSIAKLELHSVNYDPALAVCRSSVYGSLKVVNESSGTVRAEGPFVIACDRIPEATAEAGIRKYPRLELAVSTSAGPYVVVLAAEDALGYDLASKNRQAQEALNLRIQQLAYENAQLSQKMKDIKISVHEVAQGSGRAVACPQRGGNLEAYSTNICKPGVRGPLQKVGETSGGQCGYHGYRFACYTYP